MSSALLTPVAADSASNRSSSSSGRYTVVFTMPYMVPPAFQCIRVSALDVLREAQVDAAVRGIEPALGDDLGAGVEVHALRTVGVRVAEQGGLPAAEGEVGD